MFLLLQNICYAVQLFGGANIVMFFMKEYLQPYRQ